MRFFVEGNLSFSCLNCVLGVCLTCCTTQQTSYVSHAFLFQYCFFVIPKDSALILYACSLRIQKTNNVTSCMSQNDVPAAAPYYLSCSLPSIYRIIGGWAGVLAINLRDLYELRPVQKEVGCWLAQCQDVVTAPNRRSFRYKTAHAKCL